MMPARRWSGVPTALSRGARAPLPELKPVKKSRSLLAAALLLFVANDTLAQQALVSDPEIYEKKFFQDKCKVVQFDSGFVKRQDINNDGLVDAVVSHGSVVCDGERGVGCNGDGCLYNLYLQVKEGGYLMIATARLWPLASCRLALGWGLLSANGLRSCDRVAGAVMVISCSRAMPGCNRPCSP